MNERKRNKSLFIVEAIVGIASAIMLLIMVAIAATIMESQPIVGASIIVASLVTFIIICLALTKMEQIVGYYQCSKCHHKYIPTYSTVLWSMHLGRTRYMTCPKCHKKSWQKKSD